MGDENIEVLSTSAEGEIDKNKDTLSSGDSSSGCFFSTSSGGVRSH
jgi:hypothetical protein